jgi:hypothetical protein
VRWEEKNSFFSAAKVDSPISILPFVFSRRFGSSEFGSPCHILCLTIVQWMDAFKANHTVI